MEGVIIARGASAIYPEHSTTGRCGYFGNSGWVNDRRHWWKTLPRAERITAAKRQSAQRPGFIGGAIRSSKL